MSSQLQQAIDLARSLPLTEQLELLKELSTLIQQTCLSENEAQIEGDTGFSAESFRTSWQQAVTGQTLPLSQLWEGSEGD